MADDHDSDRAARIQALRKAARVERAQAVRHALNGLLGRGRAAGTWPPQVQPVALRACG